MTHPHDTPPTPDALAQVLTPEELAAFERWLGVMAVSSVTAELLPIITRLAGEVVRMRSDRYMASIVLADMHDKLRART